MKLSHRVRQLERQEALAHPPGVMERLQTALGEAALTLLRKGVSQVIDEADVARVSGDVEQLFVEKLSDGDLASLIAGLERITSPELGAS